MSQGCVSRARTVQETPCRPAHFSSQCLDGNKTQIKLATAKCELIKRPPAYPAALVIAVLESALFGGNLPRRVQRAGIVDLGDLMVAEAEHLTQDFVGVFAQ